MSSKSSSMKILTLCMGLAIVAVIIAAGVAYSEGTDLYQAKLDQMLEEPPEPHAFWKMVSIDTAASTFWGYDGYQYYVINRGRDKEPEVKKTFLRGKAWTE